MGATTDVKLEKDEVGCGDGCYLFTGQDLGFLKMFYLSDDDCKYFLRDRSHDIVASVSRVGFNVPTNTLYVILGTIITGQMTKPTVSSTEGQ